MTSWDWDDVLAYTTAKKVIVRHRWVGGIYYFACAAIVTYVIGFELVYSRGYYEIVPLEGIVKATVQSPAHFRPKSDLGYCNNTINVDCVSWDLSLISEVQPNQGLFIPTRIKEWTEAVNETCGLYNYDPNCSAWEAIGEKHYVYVGDVERGTILLQHAASRADKPKQFADTIANSFRSRRPVPWVEGTNSSFKVTRLCDCGAKGPRNAPAAGCDSVGCADLGDLFSVGNLLEALGVNLDQNSTSNLDEETLRHGGITIRLSVLYASTDKYNYQVSASSIEAKIQMTDALNMTHRVARDKHGLQILFAQGHGYKKFAFRTLLLTFVSGLALLSIAKTIADSFLRYAAPRRADYKLFVDSTTPDFSPDSAHEQKVLDSVLSAKRRKKNMHTTRTINDYTAGLLPADTYSPDGSEVAAAAGSTAVTHTGGVS